MSTKIVIKTTDRVVPMIYAYTTPEIARHNGWTKIGYTEQDVDKRLSQQTHTADVEYKEEWRGNATFEDGSGDTFTDKDFHRYLRKLNIEMFTYSSGSLPRSSIMLGLPCASKPTNLFTA